MVKKWCRSVSYTKKRLTLTGNDVFLIAYSNAHTVKSLKQAAPLLEAAPRL